MKMTKKEKMVFNRFYDDALNCYMHYVMKREDVPAEVVERALVMCELKNALMSDSTTDEGA